MQPKLQGKVALVSGSGRGIGREIALKLASEGASVVINDLDTAPAEQTVKDIVAAGGEYVIHPEDVARVGDGSMDDGHRVLDEFVKQMRAKTVQTLKKLPGPKKD